MSWTTERVEQLKSMVAEGWSYSQIATALGVTRNTAISKFHRLSIDVPNRNYSCRTPACQTMTGPASDLNEPEAAPVTGAVIPELLQLHHCRWPIGDPGEVGFHFCGERRDGTSFYCAAHRSIASAGRARAPSPY